MNRIRSIIVVLVLMMFQNAVVAQIEHNADTVLAVDYRQTVGEDSIYVVFGPGASGFSDTLRMTAKSPFGDSSTIAWYYIDASDEHDGYDSELLVEHADTTELSISTIRQGGYQVRFSKDGQDTVFTRWAYFNNLIVELFYEESCYELFLEGIEGGNTFRYFNPDTVSNAHYLVNGLTAKWQDYYLDEDIQIYQTLDSLNFDTTTTNQYFSPAPKEYKTYMFSVVFEDSLGYSRADSIVYESIAVKAEFVASQYNEEIPDSSLKFEAPLYLGFKNKSINAEIYEWTFYNDSARVIDGEAAILRTTNFYEPVDSVLFTYPGYYDVKLKVEGRVFVQDGNEKTCMDSIRERLYVSVYNSFIGELPDAVTPNEDGNNDEFYYLDIKSWDYENLNYPKNTPSTSISRTEVYIYNRYGMRVFHYDGGKWEREDAWNGKYNGKPVGSGVYYYVIKARGYDGRTFKKKGFFHVFSENPSTMD
jgi:gliding motility-associated-like protein